MTKTQQESLERAENDLLLYINNCLYRQNAITEEMYIKANHAIVEDLTTSLKSCIIK